VRDDAALRVFHAVEQAAESGDVDVEELAGVIRRLDASPADGRAALQRWRQLVADSTAGREGDEMGERACAVLEQLLALDVWRDAG
jgi:hypothetical protein